MSRLGTITINGRQYDLDDMTLDEMAAVEERCGDVAFSEINFGSTKAMKAIAFEFLRRDDPALTFADVGKVRIVDMLPPDEEMPELPPDSGAQSPNGSDPAGSGVQPSAESIAG